MKCETYGTMPDGREVEVYTLTNKNGLTAKVITYGAILTELHVPDKDGETADIVLGRDTLSEYLETGTYFGATIGRFANRIREGKFALDGKNYQLNTQGKHHLHGGLKGFDKVVWEAKAVELSGDEEAVELAYRSPDGEECYPGNLDVRTLYALNNDNELIMEYAAETDAPTPVSLTNHSYFNLAGGGDILSHQIKLHAGFYVDVDEALIPTGQILRVNDTPLDFTKAMTIGEGMKRFTENPGYDYQYVLRNDGIKPDLAAEVTDPDSGRRMELRTNAPGIQFYTGNFMNNQPGKNGAVHGKYGAFCLEPGKFPDAPNHPHFPNSILRPGETYRQTIICKFTTA